MKSAIVKSFCLLSLVVFCASCQSNRAKIQSFRYYENAKQKPIAALVPLISRVQGPDVAWDICQEITAEIQRRIINRGQLFLNPVQLDAPLKRKLETQDLIALTKEDLNTLKAQNEYAIFMELIEHQEVTAENLERPYIKSTGKIETDLLAIKVRVRVYDLRGEEPVVLLQEILHNEHIIPKVERDLDYHKVVWGGDSYPASVYGRAHAKLEKDLVNQIENYITISK